MSKKTSLPGDMDPPQSVNDKPVGRRPFVSLAARVTPEFGMRFVAFLQYTGRSHKHTLVDAVISFMREHEGKMTRGERERYRAYLLQQGELEGIENMNRPLEQFQVDPALYRVPRGRPLGTRDRSPRLAVSIMRKKKK